MDLVAKFRETGNIMQTNTLDAIARMYALASVQYETAIKLAALTGRDVEEIWSLARERSKMGGLEVHEVLDAWLFMILEGVTDDIVPWE